MIRGIAVKFEKKPRSHYINETEKGNYLNYKIIFPDGDLNNRSRIKVFCPIHGWYETSLGTIRTGCICCKCSTTQVARSQRKSREDRIRKADKIHSGFYDYSLLPPSIKNNKIKVRIICPKHGVFIQRLNDHLAGKGCLACANNDSDKSYVLLIEDCGITVGLKYGITKNLKRRHKELQAGTNFSLTSLISFQFDDCNKVAKAENEIKRNVKPILNCERFKEGFTETCKPQMLEYIIEVFKKYGGFRI